MIGSSEKLFEPDVVLPLQFFSTLPRQALRKRGEVRLLVAVIADAVECFQKYAFATDARSRRLFKEADEWIMAEGQRSDDDTPVLSFEYACDVLGLDPGYLRWGLRRWLQHAALQGRPQPIL